MYRAETWTWIKADSITSLEAEMRFLISVEGKTRKEKIKRCKT
jgi:hypothetical protein